MAQTINIWVQDNLNAAVAGAIVTLHAVSPAATYYQTTDAFGQAVFTVAEGDYTLSAIHPDMLSPAAARITVSPAPAATPAEFRPEVAAAPGLISATQKNVEISIDGGAPVTIDVSGGDDVATNEAEIAANINTALALVNPAWGSVASAVLGAVRLTSPTTGAVSTIAIRTDGGIAADATTAVFGLEVSPGPHVVTGTDSPLDWLDYDISLQAMNEFTASNPSHCMLWARFWRHDLQAPLAGATVWFHIVSTDGPPTAIDVGVDTGDSYAVTTDSRGYLNFEVMRGSKVRVFFSWLDKAIEFWVPDQASADLVRLVSPYVETIVITSPQAPVGILVGSETLLQTTGTRTDGSLAQDLAVTYTSSNSAVVSLTANKLIGVSAGTAAVTATFKNSRGEILTSAALTVQVT